MRFAAKMLFGFSAVLFASPWSVAAEPADIPDLALKAMGYRVGKWESTAIIDGVKQSKFGTAVTEWVPGKYAIREKGTFEEEGKEIHASGLIGWDPKRKQLVEHWYTSDGGYATFCYKLDAEKQTGSGTFSWFYSDGEIHEGESVIHVVNDNEWEWTAFAKVDGKTHTWRTINRRMK